MKKVSTIVPCYNVAGYLEKCVDHLLRQTIGYENIEIILVDDASTDGGETKKLIQKYEQYFPETVTAVFLEENLRQGGARNVGVSYARGEYLTFCDADDWLLEETLEHVYQIAKEYDADIVSFSRNYVNVRECAINLERGTRSRFYELDTVDKRKEYLLNMEEEDYGSQNKLFKLSLIRENNIIFAEHVFMEEASFTIPARLYAKRSVYLDERFYVYYLSQESTMRSDNWEEKKWDNLQTWISTMKELVDRGLFTLYQEELEYLFFKRGFGWGLGMLYRKHCTLTKTEWEYIMDMIRTWAPGIRQNRYAGKECDPFDRNWNQLLLSILDIKITDESVQMLNQTLLECMRLSQH